MVIEKIITWLEQRPALNLLLAVAYAVVIIFMHGTMVKVSMWLQSFTTFDTYNRFVEAAYLIFLLLLGTLLWQQFKKNNENIKLKIFYLLSTVIFIVVHSRFMFDSSIEVIHSFEFTFLVLLLFPLTCRFGAAIAFALPFMLIDELYQYLILYPDFNDYYDLNDISMDLYGCGLAMVVLMICGVQGANPVNPLWKRIEFIGLMSLSLVLLVATLLCFIAPYEFEKCSNTLLVLNERMFPEPFWRQHPINMQVFHAMKPLEGFIMFNVVTLFYFGLDSFRKTTKTLNG